MADPAESPLIKQNTEVEERVNLKYGQNDKRSLRPYKGSKVRTSRPDKYYILRFMIISTIILVTLFLITYAGYLIAVQYLVSVARKYNMQLLENNQIFIDIDVTTFNAYAHCSQEIKPVNCLINHLDLLERKGITNIILTNALDNDYNLELQFTDVNTFKQLIKEAESKHIGVYLNVEKKIYDVNDYRDLEEPEVMNNMTFIDSDKYSCIDSYSSYVSSAIKLYTSYDVDGFVLNDIPCCAVVVNFSYLEKCNFNIIKEFRILARQKRKPAVLLYKPREQHKEELLSSLYNFSHIFFDGVVRTVSVLEDATIKIPKIQVFNSSAIPKIHEIWKLSYEDFPSLKNNPEKLKLFYTILTLIKGSLQFSTKDITTKSFAVDGIKNYDDSSSDFDLIQFVAQVKAAVEDLSCEAESSAFMPDYANDGIFVGITTLNDEKFSHCVLLVNFGEVQTEVNMKAHMENSETRIPKAQIAFVVDSNGLAINNSIETHKIITLLPKTAMLLQVKRKGQ